MVFGVFIFIFSLEPILRKNIWMKTTSVTFVVISQKCYSESYFIIAWFKFRSQHLRGTLTRAIWKILYSLRFYWHGATYVLILSWANIMKRK